MRLLLSWSFLYNRINTLAEQMDDLLFDGTCCNEAVDGDGRVVHIEFSLFFSVVAFDNNRCFPLLWPAIAGIEFFILNAKCDVYGAFLSCSTLALF